MLFALQYLTWQYRQLGVFKYDTNHTHNGRDVGNKARFDDDLNPRSSIDAPSRSGVLVAAIFRSVDYSGIRDLRTKLSLDLCSLQLTTSGRVLLKLSRDTGAGHEGLKNSKNVYNRNESLHAEDRKENESRT